MKTNGELILKEKQLSSKYILEAYPVTHMITIYLFAPIFTTHYLNKIVLMKMN